MADRYEERDRDRFGGREDWDRNREFGAERYERPEQSRERRYTASRNYEDPYSAGRQDRPRGQGFFSHEDWRGGEGRRRDTEFDERYGAERDEFSSRGDWGAQGTWGTFGNRPDYSRDYEFRTRAGWGRNPEWERGGRTGYSYGGGYGTGYSGRSESGWGGSYGGYGGGVTAFSGGMGAYAERGRFAGRGPKGWRRSDDRIREDINERLTDHPDIDATEIDVQVKNGEVTLTGTVDERYAKRLAEDVAENVSGVREVHNELRIQSRGEQSASAAGGAIRSK